jgi:hypothetical protein
MMLTRVRLYSLAAILLTASIACCAETIVLKSGASITGTLVEMDARQVALKRCGRIEYYAREDVRSIQMQGVETDSTCSKPAKLELPSGSLIHARMTDHVDSFREPRGQVFLATLEQPITIDGRTVLPKGLRLLVKLIELNSGTEDVVQTLDLIAIELRRASWLDLARSDSQQPLTAASLEIPQADIAVRGSRVLVPSKTQLIFALKRAVSLNP